MSSSNGIQPRNRRNHYEVLGLHPRGNGVTERDIAKQYRVVSFQFHPDRNKDPSAVDELLLAQRAHAVLSSREERDAYDQYLEDMDKEREAQAKAGEAVAKMKETLERKEAADREQEQKRAAQHHAMNSARRNVLEDRAALNMLRKRLREEAVATAQSAARSVPQHPLFPPVDLPRVSLAEVRRKEMLLDD
eukprot:PhM_4_TR1462/c0_g1_i1/m.59824